MCTPNFHSPKLYQTMHGQNNLLSRLPLHLHPICRNHIAFSQNFPHHSQKSRCILLEFPPSFVEITFPSPGICTTHSQKSRCILLEFAPPSCILSPQFSFNCVATKYNFITHLLSFHSLLRIFFRANLHFLPIATTLPHSLKYVLMRLLFPFSVVHKP